MFSGYNEELLCYFEPSVANWQPASKQTLQFILLRGAAMLQFHSQQKLRKKLWSDNYFGGVKKFNG